MIDSLLAETILAVDHGERRIGLAIKPAGTAFGLPLGVLEISGRNGGEAELRRVVAERGATLVAVGLPLHADPVQAAKVKRFARRAREGVQGVRWRFVDESHSSAAAEERAREGGRRGRGARTDDLAALEILERFLLEEAARRRREEAASGGETPDGPP